MIDPKGPFEADKIALYNQWGFRIAAITAALTLLVVAAITTSTTSKASQADIVGRFSYMDSVSRDDDVTFYMKGLENQGIQYNAGERNSPLGILIGTLAENERIKITFTQFSRDSRIRHVIDVKILE